MLFIFFFFNDTATTEIYTLSLHDALPIYSAKKESIDTILEMAQLKTDGHCKKLVVAGCLAERYRSEIRNEIPEIDFIFGPDELGRVLEAVRLDDDLTIPDVSIDALYTSTEVPTIP